MWLLWLSVAQAEQCVPTAFDEVTLDAANSTAIAVLEIEADLEIVSTRSATVSVSGSSCAAFALKLSQKNGVITLTAKALRGEAEPPSLRLVVPHTIAALSVYGLHGTLTAHDLPLKLAVVSSEGAVDVRGVETLRVAYLKGNVTAESVRGGIAVDSVAGTVLVDGVLAE